MKKVQCPICGNISSEKQCQNCGWDFTKDVAKGFLPAQMSRKACMAYMQKLQAQKKNYAEIQNTVF